MNTTASSQSTDVSLDWQQEPFEILRRRWNSVPAGLTSRLKTDEMASISDEELLECWQHAVDEAISGPRGFPVRGWYHELYRPAMRGQKVLDVGCGLGLDGISFARMGAAVTFVDILDANVELVRRICDLMGIGSARFHVLDDLTSLDALDDDYDLMWCQGSLINAPADVIQREIQALLEHLPVGGRWIELAYPESRWVRDGRPSFETWGEKTDGPGTPWMEWYDLAKLQAAFAPATFDTILHFEFDQQNFNWFDLIRTG
jgi:SAM-dependent methyltransferase